MCGFCNEGTTIELAKVLTLGQACTQAMENRVTFEIAYLQESEHVFPALLRFEEQLKKSVAQVKAKGFQSIAQLTAEEDNDCCLIPDGWLEIVLLRVALCRIVEILVHKGFDSDDYQNLITTPLIADVITTFCQWTPTGNQRLFTSDSALREIFQSDWFFNKAPLDKILSSSDFKSDCLKLLTTYVEQWHYNRDGWEEDFESMQESFPHIFLSFIMVETHYPSHHVFAQMVHNTSGHFGVAFEALEMWLQRKAALRLHETTGLSAFLPYSKKSRPSLIYYLLVKQKLDSVAKLALREAIFQSGEYDPDQDWSFAKERMLVSMASESFIMANLD